MNDESLGSISILFQLLQTQGDKESTNAIWSRYFPRLLGLAKTILDGRNDPFGAEDAVQEAFIHFFRSVQQGKYEHTMHRDDLWRILSLVTARKARKQIRRESAQKRGSGHVVPASQVNGLDSGSFRMEYAIANLPTIEWDMILTEMLESLTSNLREVAVLRLANYTNVQIKDSLGCSLRSIERRLQIIRATWQEQL